MIDDFLGDATQRMDKSVEATHEHFNSVRTGRATPACSTGSHRLLRHADAAQEPRDDQRAGAAPADDPAVRPVVDQADREDDPGVGSGADPVERRQADPPPDPAAHRGAAEGARQGGAAHGRGGPCRRAERPARRDQASRGAGQERGRRRRRRACRRGRASRSSPTTTSRRSTSS